MAMSTVGKQWTRVRTLGRGASGAEVFLAADDASGELFAVKSAAGASSAAALRREQRVMAELRSPRVVSCIGGRGTFYAFADVRGDMRRLGLRDDTAFTELLLERALAVHADVQGDDGEGLREVADAGGAGEDGDERERDPEAGTLH